MSSLNFRAKTLVRYGLSGVFLYSLAVTLFHTVISLFGIARFAPLVAAGVAMSLSPLAWLLQYRMTFGFRLSLRSFIVYFFTQVPVLLFVGPILTWVIQLFGAHPTLAFSGAVLLRSMGSYFLLQGINKRAGVP